MSADDDEIGAVYNSHVDNRTGKEDELKKLFDLFVQKQNAS